MPSNSQSSSVGEAAAARGVAPGFVLVPRDPHEPARAWCYRVLLHNIVHLLLPPGASVAESELRKILGVSRTPVREALMQLAQEGFVNILPQKGTYVSRIDMSKVLELRYIRRCAEAETARLAATAATDAQLAVMEVHLERQRAAAAARDFEAFIAADDAMHRAMYEAADKGGVWDFFSRTNLQHFRSRILGIRVGRTLSRLIGEHEALLAALRARDPDAAVGAARKHLSDAAWNADSVRERYPEYIDPPR